MHVEVVVGAVAKELRAARPEVGEPGDVLLGRRAGCLVQVDRGHAWPLSLPETPGILSLVLVLIIPVDTKHRELNGVSIGRMEMTAGGGASAFRCARAMASF